MESLLYLVHRLPYPPNKGDKIRSYNWLKYLAQHYRVFLGAFVDSQEDWGHTEVIRDLCVDTCIRPLRSKVKGTRMIRGLLTGQSLTVSAYNDRILSAWVGRTIAREHISRALVFSSAMGQYIMRAEQRPERCIGDLVDVDSYKWRQYSARHRIPMRWVYGREARILLHYERSLSETLDKVILVTDEEAELLATLAPELRSKVASIGNGVDTGFFTPDRHYSDPYSGNKQVLVFTGAMDYWANVDGVRWFVDSVFPHVRRVAKGACFFIVGSRPTDEVSRLADEEGVYVTGAVPDVRPYLAHAKAAVVPLRIARGIQNKVLEAMAMGVPVAATSGAVEGIEMPTPAPCRIADDARRLATHCLDLLRGAGKGDAALARGLILENYRWSDKGERLLAYLEDVAQMDTAAVTRDGKLMFIS